MTGTDLLQYWENEVRILKHKINMVNETQDIFWKSFLLSFWLKTNLALEDSRLRRDLCLAESIVVNLKEIK